MIIDKVKRFFQDRVLTKQQELALMQRLKAAPMAATIGDESAACQELNGFITSVSAYASEGSLAPEASRHLLDLAGGIEDLICS